MAGVVTKVNNSAGAREPAKFNFVGVANEAAAKRYTASLQTTTRAPPIPVAGHLSARLGVAEPGRNQYGAGGGPSPEAVLDGAEDDELAEELTRTDNRTFSKFDLRRFLPATQRRRPLVIESTEKLCYLLTRLIEDLSGRGFNVTGLLSHISFVTLMASSGVYTSEALVNYDADMRERAREFGVSAFTGSDSHLVNLHLGTGGTKAFASVSAGARGGFRGGYRGGNRGGARGGSRGGRGGANQQTYTGWRKVAADKGICFSHAQGNQCAPGCVYKHQCACGATDHAMINCPNKGGDAKE